MQRGQCHCGTVQFEVELSDGFNTIRRCTCSYCRMRGAVAVSAAIGGIRFIAGENKLKHNISSVLSAESTRTINVAPIHHSMG